MRNYPAITLGALCGWVIGFSLAPYLGRFFPSEYFLAILGIVHPLCVLGGAVAISLSLPLPERPNADPMEDEKHPLPPTHLRQLFALIHPSCGMTWLQRLLHAIPWALFLLLLLGICGEITQKFLEGIGMAIGRQNVVEAITQNIHNPLLLILLGIPGCLLAPLAEEMLYRDLLPGTLTRFYFPELLAVLFSAALFAAAHQLLWAAPGFFLFALLQSHVAKKTDLLQCILIHALYNLCTLALILGTYLFFNHG